MLTGLSIRDVVLVEALDLAVGPGLTALTGETGAGKSIVLDALGLATGARADAGLVRKGAAPGRGDRDLLAAGRPSGLRLPRRARAGCGAGARTWSCADSSRADGRSRAFVNDQATGVAVLRDLGALLLEVHGQHETVGLLDSKTHRRPARRLRRRRRRARDRRRGLGGVARGGPCGGGAARRRGPARGRTRGDRAAPGRTGPARPAGGRGGDAGRAPARCWAGRRSRWPTSPTPERRWAETDSPTGSARRFARWSAPATARCRRARRRRSRPSLRLTQAAEALDRTLTEALEALAAVDAAAQAFDYEPQALEKAEERLFALRAAARKLGVPVEGLPALRTRLAEALRSAETAGEALAAAEAEAAEGERRYLAAAGDLSAARRAAGERLARAVMQELAPLKLERARFRVRVSPLPAERAGPLGLDRVEFEIATNPGSDPAPTSGRWAPSPRAESWRGSPWR